MLAPARHAALAAAQRRAALRQLFAIWLACGFPAFGCAQAIIPQMIARPAL